MKKEEVRKDIKELSTENREIIIETDGNNINIKKAEVSGKIEFIAILQQVIEHVNNIDK